MFQNQKKTFLEKTDKSIKKEIDKEIFRLVEKINKKENYYTTSSCAGRILLMEGEKKPSKWIYISHQCADALEITRIIKEYAGKKDIWFRIEPMILHVRCKDLESAQLLVNASRNLGFKRTGIQSTKNIFVEISSSEIINAIVIKNGAQIVDENYLKTIVEEANTKLKQNAEKINKLAKIFC